MLSNGDFVIFFCKEGFEDECSALTFNPAVSACVVVLGSDVCDDFNPLVCIGDNGLLEVFEESLKVLGVEAEEDDCFVSFLSLTFEDEVLTFGDVKRLRFAHGPKLLDFVLLAEFFTELFAPFVSVSQGRDVKDRDEEDDCLLTTGLGFTEVGGRTILLSVFFPSLLSDVSFNLLSPAPSTFTRPDDICDGDSTSNEKKKNYYKSRTHNLHINSRTKKKKKKKTRLSYFK